VARFKAIGLDQAAMEKWYRLFGLENPTEFQSFREWLGDKARSRNRRASTSKLSCCFANS